MTSLVSIRRLEALLGRGRSDIKRIASNAGRYYKPFDMRKQRGVGKWRHIANPTGELKVLQRKIQKNILSSYNFPDTFFGAIKGRTTIDNASYHVGSPVLLTLDLKDCFMKIRDKTIFAAYINIFKCSQEIASLLTKLTTFQHQLPQGAPTSSFLANAALLPLHHAIGLQCKQMGLKYSFYVDDITISGLKAMESIEPIIHLIHKQGHAVKRKKIHRMPGNVSQRTTGLIVNRKVSIGRTYKENLYELIKTLSMKPQIHRNELDSILGKINHVRSVSPEKAEVINYFAEKHLPKNVIAGKKIITFETRPCKDVRIHSKNRTSSTKRI